MPRGGGHVADHAGSPWARKPSSVGRSRKLKICSFRVRNTLSETWPGSGVPKTAALRSHHGSGTNCRHGRYRGDPWCCRAQSAAGGERHDRERQAEPDGFHARQVGKREQNSEADRWRRATRCRGGHEQARGHAEDGERQGRVGNGRGKDERPGDRHEQAGADGDGCGAPRRQACPSRGIPRDQPGKRREESAEQREADLRRIERGAQDRHRTGRDEAGQRLPELERRPAAARAAASRSSTSRRSPGRGRRRGCAPRRRSRRCPRSSGS